MLPRERRVKAAGYGTRGSLRVPNEKELLDEDFLANNCLEVARSDDGRWVGLRFRPQRAPVNGGLAIRGTIWLDPATYLIRRLDAEHVTGKKLDKQVSTARIDYGDVAIGDSSLPLAVGGEISYPEFRLLSRIAITYGGFEEARTP